MIEATVIMAAWRAEKTLAESVASALAQKEITLEILIVDDASTDNTLSLAKELSEQDSRVRVVGLATNGGPATARNAALSRARGEWIAVLDSDDAMVPDRLRTMVDLGAKLDADVVCDDLRVVSDFSPDGIPYLGDSFGKSPVRWDLLSYLSGDQGIPGKPSLGFLKPLFKRSFLETHNLRYDETLRNGEDFHLVMAALVEGAALWFVPEPGYLYTTRKGSVSNRLNPTHASALLDADARFLSKWDDRLTPEFRDLMQRRIDRIGNFATAETVLQSLKAKQPLAAILAFAARPRCSGRLIVQVSEAVRKRLGANGKQ